MTIHETFNATLKRFIRGCQENALTVVKLAAFKVHDDIVVRTPVDTGRCAASWTVVPGRVPSEEVAPEIPKLGPAKERTAARRAAKSFSRSVMQSAKAGQDTVWTIANNLPYVEALENGHSKQAPAGMVKLALLDVTTELQRAGGFRV